MTISTRDFQILTTLARELHFGRAADALAMRQPQLSLRIAEIERSVGAQLFQRRPRVALTLAGEVMVEAAQAAFTGFAAATERARRLDRGQAGSIITAVASSVMLSDLPILLQRFRARWPDVALSLRDMHSAEQAEALRRGLIDVAITREATAARSIRCEILGRQRFVALLPTEHPLAGQARINPAALADEPFVLFRPDVAPGLLQQINALCLRAGFLPRVEQSADEWYTVLGFVRAGFGVTIALDIFSPFAPSGVVAVQLDDPAATSPVFLSWDAERLLPTRDLLIDWLLAQARPEAMLGGL